MKYVSTGLQCTLKVWAYCICLLFLWSYLSFSLQNVHLIPYPITLSSFPIFGLLPPENKALYFCTVNQDFLWGDQKNFDTGSPSLTRFSNNTVFLNNTAYFGTLFCPFSTTSLLRLQGFPKKLYIFNLELTRTAMLKYIF